MTLEEFHMLQAERGALEKMLAEIPEDHIIDRISLEERREAIESELAAFTAPTREPVRARLTFRGSPVIGSQGISAEFGAQVIGAFSDAVAALGASQSGNLGSRGVLPGRDDYRLMITGTVLGSFGFQFEEATSGNLALFAKESPLEPAIAQTTAIMKASVGTDDELSEALSDTDPRALNAIRRLLDTMAKSEAVCSLEFKGDVFRFADVEQVRRSLGRLGQENIHESELRLAGCFLGALPERRTFEFLVEDTREVIFGKVGKEIADAEAINKVFRQPATALIHSRRAGEGRPRYVLLSYSAGSEAPIPSRSGAVDV